MSKDKIIEKFKSYLIEKGFTKSSISGYLFGLTDFLDYLVKNEINFVEFCNDDIIKYKESLNNSPQTVNVKLAAIKKYCEYLKIKRNFTIDYNIAAIKIFRKKSVEVINNFDEILENIKILQKDIDIVFRDILIFSILYYSGIRTTDLIKIKRKDVNSGYLFINDKKIVINNFLFEEINNYVNKLDLDNDDYLFFSYSRGNKKNKNTENLTVKSVEDLFNKYTKFLYKKHSINDLRNSYKFINEEVIYIDNVFNHKETYWSGDCLSFFHSNI
jgi:site-specific recombinase XerD